MSGISLDSTNLSLEDKKLIKDKLIIFIPSKRKSINNFILKNKIIYLPRSFGSINFPNSFYFLNKPHNMNSKIIFNGSMREDQIPVIEEALNYLKKDNICTLSLYCGFGKTVVALYIAYQLKVKSVIIVNTIVLMNQWEKEIKTFFNNSIKILKCPSSFDSSKKTEDYDFCIINCENLHKYGDSFKNFGLTIMDELHQLITKKNIEGLLGLQTKYLLGLSATPYRPDEFNSQIIHYFGKNIIIKQLKRKHIVFAIFTGLYFEYDIMKNGKINWTELLTKQSQCEKRNDLIIEIVKKYNNINFLILVKRIEQGKYLEEKLKEFTSVTTLLGKKQNYDESSKVLIGTSSKIGTGFNSKKINGLILASDIKEYFIQYLGRIFRDPNTNPVVFDLIDEDNFSILKNHFYERKMIYNEKGAEIKTYKGVNI